MGNGTQLGRVRGLGAGGGAVVHHWWLQRVTAVASLFLVLWFVFSLARLPSLDYASTVAWVRQPLVAVPGCLRGPVSQPVKKVSSCQPQIKRAHVNAQ